MVNYSAKLLAFVAWLKKESRQSVEMIFTGKWQRGPNSRYLACRI